MNGINIRQAQVSDCERILSMLKQLATDLGDDDIFRCRSEDIGKHGFGDQPLFHSLIAARLDLWVSPEARNLGLGKRLMEQVATRARQQWQAAYLLLMVHGHNDDAQRFYQRHGFDHRLHDQYLLLEGSAFEILSN
jgi:ribosomal protein S18 acetylase RimI-like enzyme